MAELVLGLGSSHSPLLNSPPEDYERHAEIDVRRKLFDNAGRSVSYDELAAQASPTIAQQITPDVLSERSRRCVDHIGRLSRALADAELDALIVVGDDQNEQFRDDNMPALSLYWGDSIENRPLHLPDDAPSFWRQARSQFHELAQTRSYPVDGALARHLIARLVESGFDPSSSRRLSTDHGEGHAFGFAHRRLMAENVIPIVPVAINTYFPPNQPTPRRCLEVGRAIAAALESWDRSKRIGILASGGLSHFVVDEQLDRFVLDAAARSDLDALCSISLERLNSGTSEIRNWIVVAGAAERLEMQWSDYVPCYRSPAGTGCGMGFAIWRKPGSPVAR
jgi:3-O-methylgallate 3,4-dioxygenase